MSLKQRALRGLSWSFFDKFANYVLQFVIGIILARLLTPEEYGLTGMLAVFVSLCNAFIISGFGETLIWKKDPSWEDYSTVFIFNIAVSLLAYLLFFGAAPYIADFFDEPVLQDLVAFQGLLLLLTAFGLVPRVLLYKRLDFQSLAKISVSSNLVAGLSAIALAYAGFGVWSLVWRGLIQGGIETIMLLVIARPGFPNRFRYASFSDLFGYSSKLLITHIIDVIFMNAYHLVIGKYFSARQLGLYTRANGYKDLPARTLNDVIQSVSYPVLAEIKDDEEQFKRVYRKFIQVTTYLSFILLFGLAATSEHFIVALIGRKWEETVPYLQLLCFVGMFYPLISFPHNAFKLKGRPDLLLKISVFMKVFTVPVVIVGLVYGIIPMIIGMWLAALISYGVSAYMAGKLIDYSIQEQLQDIFPSFLTGMAVGAGVYLLDFLLDLPSLPLLLVQCLLGLLFTIVLSSYFHLKPFQELKQIIGKQLTPRLASLSSRMDVRQILPFLYRLRVKANERMGKGFPRIDPRTQSGPFPGLMSCSPEKILDGGQGDYYQVLNADELPFWISFFEEGIRFPGYRYFRIDEATVISRGLTLHRGKLLMESAIFQEEYLNMLGKNHQLFLHRFFPKRLEKIENAVCLDNCLWNNYYHWTMEGLARLAVFFHYTQEADRQQLKIVIADDSPAFVGESLQLMLGIPEENIVWSRRKPWKMVNSFLPFFPHIRSEATRMVNIYDPLSVELINRLSQRVQLPSSQGPRRIIINRQGWQRRILNMDYLVEGLQEFDFSPVVLEGMPYIEQLRLFQQAEVIIAVHGAGLVNLVYSRPEQCICLELYPKSRPISDACYFFQLSRVLKIQHYLLMVDDDESQSVEVDVPILDELKQILASCQAPS